MRTVRKADAIVTQLLLGWALQLGDALTLQEITELCKADSKKSFKVLSISKDETAILKQFKHDHCKRHVHTLVVDDVDSDSATLKMLFFIIDKFSHSSSKCLHLQN